MNFGEIAKILQYFILLQGNHFIISSRCSKSNFKSKQRFFVKHFSCFGQHTANSRWKCPEVSKRFANYISTSNDYNCTALLSISSKLAITHERSLIISLMLKKCFSAIFKRTLFAFYNNSCHIKRVRLYWLNAKIQLLKSHICLHQL